MYISILARNVSFQQSTKFFYVPIVFLLALLPALQYGVGSDYFSYVKIVESGGWVNYEGKYEFLSALLIRIAGYSDYPQLLFVLQSAINAMLACIAFAQLKRAGFAISFALICYIAITSAYFNQLNLIRQYLAAHVLLLMPFFGGKSNSKLLALSMVAFMFHAPSALASSLIWFVLRVPWPSNGLLFLVSPFVIGLSATVALTVAFHAFPFLSIYKEIDYNFNIMSIVTKAYYLPLALALHPSVHRHTPFANSRTVAWGLRIWCATYFLFIAPLFVPIDVIVRVIHYFMLFYIFPAVILTSYVQRSEHIALKVAFWLWIVLPMVIKVSILPSGEYIYDWVL